MSMLKYCKISKSSLVNKTYKLLFLHIVLITVSIGTGPMTGLKSVVLSTSDDGENNKGSVRSIFAKRPLLSAVLT